MHELVVFYRYLDILIHFTHVVDVSSLQRANFRPKIGQIRWFSSLYADFDVNQQHLLRLRSWIHQNVSEFHGESDGKALHACGRSENAKIIHVIIHVIVARLYQRLVYREVRCVSKYSFSQDTFSQFWRCSHEMRELRLNVLVGIYPRINCSGFFRVLQRFSRYGQFLTKAP